VYNLIIQADEIFEKYDIPDGKGEACVLNAIYHIRHLIKLSS
jgi:hypothetical protein